MKDFFKKIGASFYDATLYQKARTEPASSGLKFAGMFLVFLILLLTVASFVLFLVFMPKLTGVVEKYLNTNFPEELVITIQDKKISTNQEGPVYFPVPFDIEKYQDEKIRKNLVVVAPMETTADFALFDKYDAYGVVTADTLLMSDNEGRVRGDKLDYKNMNIDKNTAIGALDTLIKEVKPVMPFILLFAISILMIYSFVFNLLLLLVTAVILFFLFKIQKREMAYWDIYKMGIYTMVPVFVLSIVFLPLRATGPLLSFVVTGLVILLAMNHTKDITLQPVETNGEKPKEEAQS